MKNIFLVWFFFILQICTSIYATERIISADVISGQISVKNLLGDKGHFEKNALGWSGYDDAAAVPVDGTGGTVTTTCTRTTSTPLSGVGSFLYTPAALGEGCSTPFTVETKDTAGTVLQVSFDYSVVSGTYTDDDTQIWIYDVTAGVPTQPTPYKLKKHTLTSQPFAVEFQTTSGSTSYRLLLHQATSGTAVLKFDNITVGKQAKLYGSPITDPVAYTTTLANFGNGTATTNWAKRGKFIKIMGTLIVGSSLPSGIFTFTLPSGLTADYSTLPKGLLNTDAYQNVGTAHAYAGGKHFTANVFRNSASSSEFYFHGDGTTYGSASGDWNATVPVTWSAGQAVEFELEVPISGWSSSAIMSADADTRVIAARYSTNAGNPVASGGGTRIDFEDKGYDTHGAVTTGASWSFTASTPGYYRCSGRLTITGTPEDADFRADVYYNAVLKDRSYRYVQQTATDTQVNVVSWATTEYLLAGQTIYVTGVNAAGTSLSTNAAENWIAIEKLSGPAQIAASETVSALYTGAPPTGTLTSSYNTTTFGTKVKDTHGAYVSGTYTVPISGIYDIAASTARNATYALNSTAITGIYVDGVQKYIGVLIAGGAQTSIYPAVRVKSVPLLAGQLVTIKSYDNGTTPTFVSDAASNYFSIVRSGNF